MRRSTKLIQQSNLHQQRRAAELARRRKLTDAERLHEMSAGAAARAQTHAVTSAAARESEARAAESNSADALAKGAAESSRRTFYRHLRTVLVKADIILEVLDARDPMACRAPEVEELILRAEGNKKLVLVLNKIDLVPPAVVQAWLRYLRQSFPAVAFKASTQQQKSNLAAAGGAKVNRAVRSGEVLTGSGAAGADILMQLIKNYSRSHDKKKAVTVGIIGYPNVGKSSIINSLKRNRAVGVSSVPGFTKTAQEVQLDAKVRLLDCPGIIFDDGAGSGGLDDGGAGLLLRNCVSVESMPDPELAVAGILRRCEPAKLMALYRLARFSSADEFLTLVARQRGKLLRGGEPDTTAAARAVLQDWNSGNIPFFTAPPAVADDHERAAIVTEWSKVRQPPRACPPSLRIHASRNDARTCQERGLGPASRRWRGPAGPCRRTPRPTPSPGPAAAGRHARGDAPFTACPRLRYIRATSPPPRPRRPPGVDVLSHRPVGGYGLAAGTESGCRRSRVRAREGARLVPWRLPSVPRAPQSNPSFVLPAPPSCATALATFPFPLLAFHICHCRSLTSTAWSARRR